MIIYSISIIRLTCANVQAGVHTCVCLFCIQYALPFKPSPLITQCNCIKCTSIQKYMYWWLVASAPSAPPSRHFGCVSVIPVQHYSIECSNKHFAPCRSSTTLAIRNKAISIDINDNKFADIHNFCGKCRL